MFSPSQVETVKKALGDIEAGKYRFPLDEKPKKQQEINEERWTQGISGTASIAEAEHAIQLTLCKIDTCLEEEPKIVEKEPAPLEEEFEIFEEEPELLEEEPEIFEEEPEPQKKDEEQYKDWARKVGLGRNYMPGERKIIPRPYKSTCREPFKWTIADILLVREEFKNFAFILDCGAGAFGRVWLVKDDRRGVIALKILPKSAVFEIINVQLYRTKVTDFSYLLKIYETGETRHFYYYTMEAAYSYDSGEYKPYTLDLELLKKHFTADETIPVIGDILLGALHLHDNGVAHRDIKPNNIIFIDSKPKLADVGLICLLSEMSTWGTFGFLPVDLRHETDILKWRYRGVDCDLFAVGKVLYLMLSGYMLGLFPEVSEEVLKDEKGKRLNLIMNKACAETKNERYQNAKTFYDELMCVKQEHHIYG